MRLLGKHVDCQKLPRGFSLQSVCQTAASRKWILTEIIMAASTSPMAWAQEAHLRGFSLYPSSVLMYTLCTSYLNLAYSLPSG